MGNLESKDLFYFNQTTTKLPNKQFLIVYVTPKKTSLHKMG